MSASVAASSVAPIANRQHFPRAFGSFFI